MDGLYNQTLHNLDKAFKKLEAMVPPPQRVQQGDGFVCRFVEKTIQQAMVQKLARVISGLHAARLLLDNGHLQEQGAVHRMLDEFHEDILFLAYAVILKEDTSVHREYLEHFYQEEDKLHMVRRWKVRAYVAEAEAQLGVGDSKRGAELSNTLYSGYSRFVHGRSAQIMEMFFGHPARFHLHGMGGTPRQDEHRYDLYNPFFRAIIGFAVVAKAFGDDELSQSLHAWLLEFDRLSGRNEAFRGESER